MPAVTVAAPLPRPPAGPGPRGGGPARGGSAALARAALLLAAACAAPRGSEPADLAEDAPRTRVVLLGTGTPNADPERSGPALAIVVGQRSYLVDCGPGVVRRAAAAARAHGIAALEPDRLERVFLTHLHSDHTLGLPDLLFTPWVLERVVPLFVVGPPGTRALAEHVEAAWEEDVALRIHGLEGANPTGCHAVVREVEPGLCFEDDVVRVEAFRVPHGSWESAYGYRFTTPDRTIVVSGDTGPFPGLAEIARGADVLVHEVYSLEGFAGRPPQWQRYHASFHTSTAELAEIALRARPKLLVLTHQLLWGAPEESLVRELREAGWDGPVVSGRDLDVL